MEQGGRGRAYVRHAGGCRRVSIRPGPSGTGWRADTDCREPLRLSVAGAALHSTAPAESFESWLGESGERGDSANPEGKPGQGIRAFYAGENRTALAVAGYRMACEGWPLDKTRQEANGFGMHEPVQEQFLTQFASDLAAGKIQGYPLKATPPPPPVTVAKRPAWFKRRAG